MENLLTRNGIPQAPVELADAVEVYARNYGRSATLHFFPTQLQGMRVLSGTWVVRFALRVNDTRMALYRDGKVEEPPTEDVWIHVPNPRAGRPTTVRGEREPDYLPIDILQMGVSGLREFLEKGNTWSGRGEFASIEQHLQVVREGNVEGLEKNRAQAKETARFQQREKRRFRFKIPFVGVSVDLRPGDTSKETAP